MSGPAPTGSPVVRTGLPARAALDGLGPLVAVISGLDAAAPLRIRTLQATVSLFSYRPFDVLISRTVPIAGGDARADPAAAGQRWDTTVLAGELHAWLTGQSPAAPADHGDLWHGGLPPAAGWRRVECISDDVIRSVVRSGARLARGDGDLIAGSVHDRRAAAVLDSVVLTVRPEADLPGAPGETQQDAAGHMPAHQDPVGPIPSYDLAITLRPLAALTRLGFLPEGTALGVDVSRSWIRLAGTHGAAYARDPRSTLVVL